MRKPFYLISLMKKRWPAFWFFYKIFVWKLAYACKRIYIKKKMFFRNPIHKPARVYRRWFATLWATCLWNRWLSATNRTWSRNTWFLRYGWPAISPSTGLLRFSPTAAKCATCKRDSTIFNWTTIHPLRYVVCMQTVVLGVTRSIGQYDKCHAFRVNSRFYVYANTPISDVVI